MVFDISRWLYISLLQVFVIKGTLADYCTEQYYSYVLMRYAYRSLYCSSSCCGTYPDESCCGLDLGLLAAGTPAVIAGAVVGGLVGLGLLIGLIVCIVIAVKKPKRQVGTVLHANQGTGHTVVVGQTMPYNQYPTFQPPPPYTNSTVYGSLPPNPVQPSSPAYHNFETGNPPGPPPAAPPPPQLYPQHI